MTSVKWYSWLAQIKGIMPFIFWEFDGSSALDILIIYYYFSYFSMSSENSSEEKKEWSLLESIIEASKNNPTPNNEASTEINHQKNQEDIPPSWNTPPPPKKPKQPLDPILILKFIGVLLLVGVIFFGSFLAYIVFNPAQAQFFVTMFRINPDDIASLLTKLLNGSFGILILSLSILWIISLFRAIWIPKDLKRKKMIGWIGAAWIGIILFSTLAFWWYLYEKIWKTHWDNLDWVITIMDASLLNNPDTKNEARLQTTNNLIGPINLQFDISGNAKNLEETNPVHIDSYEIDFNGAICNGWDTKLEWQNPLQKTNITCTFDQIKLYNIKWIYHVTSRTTWEKTEVNIPIPAIEIRWLIGITKQKNKDGKDIITLDASSLKKIGNPKWTYFPSRKTVEASSITESLSHIPNIIWLTIFPGNTWIDRIFLLQDESINVNGSIIANPDMTKSPLSYILSLTGNIDQNSILGIEWSLNDGSIICKWVSDICEYNFWSYWNRTIYAKVQLANKESFTLEKYVSIDEPIQLARHVYVTDKEWRLLNTPETLDPKLKSYVIKNILPPDTISLDARDVVTENPWYTVEWVRWIIQYGKTKEEKEWQRVNVQINTSIRYTIQAIYTINKNIAVSANDTKTATEIIIIDTERKSLMPKIIVQSTSDYVPTLITVDGSQSKSENWEIKKFIYNFWEGKPDAMGDAIQQYQYTTPGEKEITLTVVNDWGEMESIKKIIVLKEAPRTTDFAPSISPWIKDIPVDFSVNQSNGQVDDFVWNFWDNTPSQHGMSVTHTFNKEGQYNINLTIIFADGTQKLVSKGYTVVTSIE
jgi:PKD repeat protein